jgi:hypothetical protein
MIRKLKKRPGGPLDPPRPPKAPPPIEIPGRKKEDPREFPEPPAPPGYMWEKKGKSKGTKKRGRG